MGATKKMRVIIIKEQLPYDIKNKTIICGYDLHASQNITRLQKSNLHSLALYFALDAILPLDKNLMPISLVQQDFVKINPMR